MHPHYTRSVAYVVVHLLVLHCEGQVTSVPLHKGCKPIPCNEYRIPAMTRGVPYNKNRFFPVRISTQGKPCSLPVLALYGIAVCPDKFTLGKCLTNYNW